MRIPPLLFMTALTAQALYLGGCNNCQQTEVTKLAGISLGDSWSVAQRHTDQPTLLCSGGSYDTRYDDPTCVREQAFQALVRHNHADYLIETEHGVIVRIAKRGFCIDT